MTELHDRFRAWLLAGAPGEPARDVALHATACGACLAAITALDGLRAVDVGAAEVPLISATTAPGMSGTVRALRAMSGVTAVSLLVVAAMIGAGAFRDRDLAPGTAANPTGSPDGEGILGGAGGPSPTPRPDASSEAGASEEPGGSGTAEPTPGVAASDGGGVPTQPPFIAPPPPAITPGPTAAVTPRPTGIATQPPTAGPTATPTVVPTIQPTPDPTPEPTPVPTPEPTPMPTPPPSEAPPTESPAP